jgi:hypothetical protein
VSARAFSVSVSVSVSDNDTPAAIQHLDNRAWESDWYPPCRIHPQTRARRPNGQCAACWTDRREGPDAGVIRDRGGRPIPAEARSAVDAALSASKPPAASKRATA